MADDGGYVVLLDSGPAQAAMTALNNKIEETRTKLSLTGDAAETAATKMKAAMEGIFQGAELKGAAKDTAKLIELQAQMAAYSKETAEAIVNLNKHFLGMTRATRETDAAIKAFDKGMMSVKTNAAKLEGQYIALQSAAGAHEAKMKQQVNTQRLLNDATARHNLLLDQEQVKKLEVTAAFNQESVAKERLLRSTAEYNALKNQEIAADHRAAMVKEVAVKQMREVLRAEAMLEAAKKGDIVLSERQAKAYDLVTKENISYEQAIKRVDAALDKKAAAERKAAAEAERNKRATDRASRATSKFRNHLLDAEGAAAGFRAGLRALGTSIGMFTGSTILIATAVFGAVRAFREMLTVGSQFEASMERAFAVMQIPDFSPEAEALTNVVRNLGATTMIASTEVAEGLQIMGMAGLSASEAMNALAPTVGLAIVGMLDMKDAADITTSILAGFGLEASMLAAVVDDMSTAVVSSKMDISQLGTAMSYVSPVAKTLGINVQEVIASLEALHNAGIKASRAGTGMRRVLLNLYNPTTKGAKALAEAGVAAIDYAGNTRPLIDVIEDLNKAQKEGKFSAEQMTDVVGVRMMPVLASLVESVNRGEKSLRSFRNALDDNDQSLQTLVDRLQSTTQAKWEIFKSAATDLGVSIFNSLKPAIDWLLEKTTTVLQNLKDAFDAYNRAEAGEGYFTENAMVARGGPQNVNDTELWLNQQLDELTGPWQGAMHLFESTSLSMMDSISEWTLDFFFDFQREVNTTTSLEERAMKVAGMWAENMVAAADAAESLKDKAPTEAAKELEAAEQAATRLYNIFKRFGNLDGVDAEAIATMSRLIDVKVGELTPLMEASGGMNIQNAVADQLREAMRTMESQTGAKTKAEVDFDEAQETVRKGMDALYEFEVKWEEYGGKWTEMTDEQKAALNSLISAQLAAITATETLFQKQTAVMNQHGAQIKIIEDSERALAAEIEPTSRLIQIRERMAEIDEKRLPLLEQHKKGMLDTTALLTKLAGYEKEYVKLQNEKQKIEEKQVKEADKKSKHLEKLEQDYEKLTLATDRYTTNEEAILDLTSQLVPVNKQISELNTEQAKSTMTRTAWLEKMLPLLKDQKQLEAALMKVLKEIEKDSKDRRKAQQEELKNIKAIAKEYGSVKIAIEEYSVKIDDLNKAYAAGYLSAVQYADGLNQINKELELATASNAVEEMLIEWKYQFEELDEVAAGWLEGFTDQLAEFVRTGKADFKDLVDSILDDLARLVARQFVVSIGAAFGMAGGGGGMGGGMFGAPGGGGNIFSSLFGNNSEGEPFRLSDIGKNLTQMFTGAATSAPLNWASAGKAATMGVNPGTQLALLEGSYGPASAPLFGGTAMGYGLAGMGGSLIGGWLAPDSPYGSIMGSLGGMAGYGLGAGMGSAGGMLAGTQFAALAGPIGAVVGAVLGSVLSKVFDKAPRAAFLNTSTEDASDSSYRTPGWEDGMEGGHYVETPFGYMGLSDRTRDISGADEKAITDGLKDLADLDKLISDALGKDRTEMAKEALHNYKYFDKSGGGGLEEFGLGRIEIMAESTDLDFGDYVMQGNPDLEEAGTRLITVAEVQKYMDDAGGLEREDMLRRNTSGADIEHFAQAATTLVDIETYMEEIGKELKYQDMMWQQIENNLGDSEALTKLRDYVVAMVAIDDYLTADFMADYQEGVEEANKSLTDKYYEQIDSVYELIDTYDGSIDKTIELGQALTTQYQNTMALINLIESMKVSVADMFASTSEKIMLSGMDDKEKFDYYRTGADSLTEQLATETDPEKIAKLTEQINQKINSSWDLLDEDQQDQKRQEYLDYLDDVNELAQERLEIAEQETLSAAEELKDAINDAFGPIAADFQTAANDMNTAADKPVNVNVDVDVDVTGPATASYETSYTGSGDAA